MKSRIMYSIVKRFFDLIASLIMLLLLSPLFIIIALTIKIDSKGPVFYLGGRIGKFGKLFKLYKFRTMRVDADQISQSSSAGDDDPRITKFGYTLRTYKLNELPQFINVLKGDMSFVGPRPQVEWDVKLYTEEEKAILTVPPGITDYASIKFHNEGEILKGSVDPDKTYMEKIRPEKIRLQLEYIKTRSLWVDFKVLLETATTLIKTRIE